VSPVPVLMYHAVDTAETSRSFQRFVISPDAFVEHLDILRSLGYTTVTASEVGRAATGEVALPPKAVALTFDDAFAELVQDAVPALLDRDMTATVFVPTSFIAGRADWLTDGHGSGRRVLDPDGLLHLQACGIECGAHSRTHPEMDRIGSAQLLCDEAHGARHDLEAILGRRVMTFAYPFGYHSRAARRAVAESGYAAAFAVSERAAQPRIDDRFALPRFTVNAGLTPSMFERLLNSPRNLIVDGLADSKRHVWRWWRRAGWQTRPRVDPAVST
jgi:peptidoglycan/xylan/chitin deacetylase (PgdA/CDA1 family)